MPFFRHSLISDVDRSEPIMVRAGQTRLSISFVTATTTTWGSAVVNLRRSVEIGKEADVEIGNYQDLKTAVKFTSATTSIWNISVTPGFYRLETTTADSGADHQAIVTWRLD